MTGTIIHLNPTRGFGFIQSDGENHTIPFFKYPTGSAVGQKVEFEKATYPKTGGVAEKLRVIPHEE